MATQLEKNFDIIKQMPGRLLSAHLRQLIEHRSVIEAQISQVFEELASRKQNGSSTSSI